MTNLEALEKFNEAIKPYLEAHPKESLSKTLWQVEYFLDDKEQNFLLFPHNTDKNFINSIKRMLNYFENGD